MRDLRPASAPSYFDGSASSCCNARHAPRSKTLTAFANSANSSAAKVAVAKMAPAGPPVATAPR
eukprot:6590105-Lingulodinium_polyedra.AAC.1